MPIAFGEIHLHDAALRRLEFDWKARTLTVDLAVFGSHGTATRGDSVWLARCCSGRSRRSRYALPLVFAAEHRYVMRMQPCGARRVQTLFLYG
jgi:hypothetical protein